MGKTSTDFQAIIDFLTKCDYPVHCIGDKGLKANFLKKAAEYGVRDGVLVYKHHATRNAHVEAMEEAMKLTNSSLSKRQTRGIKSSFEAMDMNHDGKISMNELKQACKKLGILLTKEELAEVMGEADADGNGTIDYKEYETLVGQQLLMAEYKNQQMMMQFQRFDKDGTGYITAKAIKSVFSELGVELTDEDVQELVEEADENGDGLISFEEFVNSVCEKDW